MMTAYRDYIAKVIHASVPDYPSTDERILANDFLSEARAEFEKSVPESIRIGLEEFARRHSVNPTLIDKHLTP